MAALFPLKIIIFHIMRTRPCDSDPFESHVYTVKWNLQVLECSFLFLILDQHLDCSYSLVSSQCIAYTCVSLMMVNDFSLQR